jgi:hypothetical protein
MYKHFIKGYSMDLQSPIRCGLLGLVVSLLATIAAAQPPPVGPPPNRAEKGNLFVSTMTNLMRDRAQATVDETNARLKREGRSSRVSIESLRVYKPYRSKTDALNQPNSWFVRTPYILKIKVAIPASFDRHISIPIDVNVFCDGWHMKSGTVTVRSKPGPASIEGGNILEDVIHVRDYIDAKVRSAFNPTAPLTMPLPLTKCSTIGASDRGTEAAEDDVVVWDEPFVAPTDGVVARPTIEVTFDRLKRLRARQIGGAILYKEVEEILLNTYANYSQLQKGLSMREGDEVVLNLPTVRLDARKFDMLVVIGNVEQPPNNPKDSAFAATAKVGNYSPGSHVLQIPKWYSMPPDRLNPKPRFFSVPAYELHYTVRFIDAGVAHR